MKQFDITLLGGREKVVYCHAIWRSFAVKDHQSIFFWGEPISLQLLTNSKSWSQFIDSYVVNGPRKMIFPLVLCRCWLSQLLVVVVMLVILDALSITVKYFVILSFFIAGFGSILMSQSFSLKSIVERKSQVFFLPVQLMLLLWPHSEFLSHTVDVVIDVNFIVVDVVVVDVTVVDAVLVADVIVIDSVVVADVIDVDAVFVVDVIVVDAVVVSISFQPSRCCCCSRTQSSSRRQS